MKMSNYISAAGLVFKFQEDARKEGYTERLSILIRSLQLACMKLCEKDSKIRELEVKISEMNEYQKGNWFLLYRVK